MSDPQEHDLVVSPTEVARSISKRGSRGMTIAQLVADLLGQPGWEEAGRSEARRALRPVLKELELDGRIVLGRGKRYFTPDHSNLVIGTLRMTSGGHALVKPDGPASQNIRIPSAALRGALDGDRVQVRVERPRKRARAAGLREGVVAQVLERRRRQVVGRWEARRGRPLVQPIDRRMPLPVEPVAIAIDGEPADGELVVISIDEVTDRGHRARGTVLERLGWLGDPGVDELVVVRHFELPDSFPPDALAEAAAAPEGLSEAEVAGRWDLRDRPVITIDPQTARDFDDAANAVAGPGDDVTVEVHIADVSHYVRPGSALDAVARERGTSVYLPGRCLAMLPERISSDLCCLREGVDRPAMTVRYAVSPAGDVRRVEVGESVIHSRRRCTYEEALEWLETPLGSWSEETAEFADSLALLAEAADRLRSARRERGSLDFELPEPVVELDDDGRVTRVRASSRNRAHRLVEELMVAANAAVAGVLLEAEQPGIHRAHDTPDPVRVQELENVLQEFGLRLDRGDDETLPAAALQEVLARAAGRPEERLVATLVLRTLARAAYSAGSRGHYALALDEYLHFTSPIRRYPDLVCHRQLRRLLREGPLEEARQGEVTAAFERLAEACSATEQRAEAAERMAVHLKTLVYLQGRCGEVFGGVVTGVTSFGVFVQLDEVFVDGMIHVSELDDDYYELEERRQRLVGQHSGRALRLGDRMEVRLARVDLDNMQLELVPAVRAGSG